jgi:hypothetical protein
MFFREWNVLIVDDEPDVLTVTRLALKDVTVFGLPLKSQRVLSTLWKRAQADLNQLTPAVVSSLKRA